jgi:hypothetical protein
MRTLTPMNSSRYLRIGTVGQDMAFIKMGFPVSFTNVWVATPTDDDPAAVYRDALVKKFNELGIPAPSGEGRAMQQTISNSLLDIALKKLDHSEFTQLLIYQWQRLRVQRGGTPVCLS